jgi:hypothetical protein
MPTGPWNLAWGKLAAAAAVLCCALRYWGALALLCSALPFPFRPFTGLAFVDPGRLWRELGGGAGANSISLDITLKS